MPRGPARAEEAETPRPPCPRALAQQWHSHHPVEAPGQQLPAPPQALPHAQGLVSGTHGALQGKGHCQCCDRALPVCARALPAPCQGLPWLPHPPWLRCSRPPHPPWARTWGTPAPLERQARSGVCPHLGSCHPPNKPRISASVLEAQCSPPRCFGGTDEGRNSLQSPEWCVAMEQQHVAGKTLKCPNPAPEARNRTGNGHWELPSELGIGTGNQYTCCWNWGHYWERGLA